MHFHQFWLTITRVTLTDEAWYCSFPPMHSIFLLCSFLGMQNTDIEPSLDNQIFVGQWLVTIFFR